MFLESLDSGLPSVYMTLTALGVLKSPPGEAVRGLDRELVPGTDRALVQVTGRVPVPGIVQQPDRELAPGLARGLAQESGQESARGLVLGLGQRLARAFDRGLVLGLGQRLARAFDRGLALGLGQRLAQASARESVPGPPPELDQLQIYRGVGRGIEEECGRLRLLCFQRSPPQTNPAISVSNWDVTMLELILFQS